MYEINLAKRLSHAWVHFVTALASLFADHKKSGLPLLRNTQRCSNHVFLLEQLKSDQGEENLTQKQSRGLTTWKVTRKSALKVIVTWQIKKWAAIQSFTSLLGWSPIQEGRTWINWRILKSLPQNLSRNACTWHELVSFGLHSRRVHLKYTWSRNDVGIVKINVFDQFLPHKKSHILLSSSHFDIIHVNRQE